VASCSTVLQRTVEACREAAEERSVQLASEPGKAGDIAISERRAVIASLILANLVRNAIDASPVGGAVRTQAHAEGESVKLSVIDEGPGFSETALANLFAASRSQKPGGAGIGLAISRQLARHIGGTLNVDRTGPSGSVVSLKIGARE